MTENYQDSLQKALEEDDLINNLIPDPDSPDVNVLVGAFLGRGSDEKSIRVYTTVRLDAYFQVPKDKVLGVKRFATGQIAVWIPADLKLQAVASCSLSGDFLKGSIQSAFSGRGTGGLRSSVARLNQQQEPISRSPFCSTDVPDPSNPICGLTASGCPSGPQC